MISQETVDTILSTAQIDEVVSDFVRLKKRGVNYLGLCPFHEEKTPSFTVSPAKGIFKCFGCGKAGNSVGFIMEHEKLSYPEALKYLASKYNIEVEETGPAEGREEGVFTQRESLYIVLAAAQKFFTDALNESEEGKTVGKAYIKERGISPEMAERFQLGWSFTSRTTFSDWALKNKFEKEFLLGSGMSIEGREGGLFDRFHERVIFPIHNLSGKVVGFGGRIIRSNTKEAKYINSPETEVYNKSQVLYGLFQAKKAIRQQDYCILVEGYTDVISMHQAGIENVAASSGTSLTEEHLKLVKRFTENVIFLFDGDEAGKKASVRALDMALAQGVNAKVVTLPSEHDPDSFAKANDREEIEAFLKSNAKNFVQFKASLLSEAERNDPVEKSKAVRFILGSINLLNDPILEASYIKELEKLLGVEEKLLYDELKRIRLAKLKEINKSYNQEVALPVEKTGKVDVPAHISAVEQEKNITRLLLLYGSSMLNEEQRVAHHIIDELQEVEWEDDICRKIFLYFETAVKEQREEISYQELLNSEDREIQQRVTQLLSDKDEISPNWKTFLGRPVALPIDNYRLEVVSALRHFKLRKVLKLLDENKKDLKNAATQEEQDQFLAIQIHLDGVKRQLIDEINAAPII